MMDDEFREEIMLHEALEGFITRVEEGVWSS
jgi:hypothetical protein